MYVNRFEQRNLAWRLMDVVGPSLGADARACLNAQIGAGDLENALFDLVDLCMREDLTLPPDAETLLRRWAGGYAGTDIAAYFTRYIGDAALLGVDGPEVATAESRLGLDPAGTFDHRPRRMRATEARI